MLIRRYRDLPEAIVAKSILDSAGVESFLIDQNLVRLDWFWSNLLGGIKLLVQTDDAEAAAELINQPVPKIFDVEGEGEYKQPSCPRCQSLDVDFRGLKRHLVFAILFLGLPVPITNRAWRCHSCRRAWEEDGGGLSDE